MSANPTASLSLERRQHTQQTLRELLQALRESNAPTAQSTATTADISSRDTDQRLNDQEMIAYNASASQTYLRNLPVVDLSELEPDSSDCAICHEPFTTELDGEGPVKMTCCGRIFDVECITTWLSSAISQGRCPNCRTELFAPPSYNQRRSGTLEQHTIESLGSRLPNDSTMNSAAQESLTWTPQESAILQLSERRLHEILSMPLANMSAWRVFVAFKFLVSSDPLLLQPERVHRWELLAAHIETVRARLVPPSGELELDFGSLWNQQGPSVPMLLIVGMRPLVEAYLEQLVRAEGAMRRG